MSLEELSKFVRELNLLDSPSAVTDAARTLGSGLPKPISTDSPASHQTAQSKTHMLSTLCKTCQSIFTDASQRRPGQIHHHGIGELRVHAGKGCQLCLAIHMSMDPSYLMKFQRTVPDSQGIASFTPISRDQARLQFRYISAAASDPESFDSTSPGQKQKATLSVYSNKSLDVGEVHVLSVDFILVRPECTSTTTAASATLTFNQTRSSKALDFSIATRSAPGRNRVSRSPNAGYPIAR
jgi:hypothetical protein